MIVKNRNYWVISKNSNTNYWGQDVSPSWTAIGTFIYHPGQEKGVSVEPHYHDVWRLSSAIALFVSIERRWGVISCVALDRQAHAE